MKRLAAFAALLLAAVACGDDSGPPAASPSAGPAVTVQLLAFNPGALRVPVGSTVTWRSAENITHTVTSGEVSGIDATSGLRAGEKPDGRFDGQLPGKDSTFSFTFAEAGTYSYFCSIHKGMNARIDVA